MARYGRKTFVKYTISFLSYASSMMIKYWESHKAVMSKHSSAASLVCQSRPDIKIPECKSHKSSGNISVVHAAASSDRSGQNVTSITPASRGLYVADSFHKDSCKIAIVLV